MTVVPVDVPGSTPMEQKKNLEESGIPTTAPSGEEPLPGAPGDQTSGDDDDFVSLEELKKMSLEDLQRFISDNSLTAPVEAQSNAPDLLDWLLAEYGVDA